jgi:hypothetical protein
LLLELLGFDDVVVVVVVVIGSFLGNHVVGKKCDLFFSSPVASVATRRVFGSRSSSAPSELRSGEGSFGVGTNIFANSLAVERCWFL